MNTNIGNAKRRGRPTNGQKLFKWLAAQEAKEPGRNERLRREQALQDAAPEMLAALEAFDRAINLNRYNLTKEMQEAIALARNAIAKAKGGAT